MASQGSSIHSASALTQTRVVTPEISTAVKNANRNLIEGINRLWFASADSQTDLGISRVYTLMISGSAPLLPQGHDISKRWKHSIQCSLPLQELQNHGFGSRSLPFSLNLIHGCGVVTKITGMNLSRYFSTLRMIYNDNLMFENASRLDNEQITSKNETSEASTLRWDLREWIATPAPIIIELDDDIRLNDLSSSGYDSDDRQYILSKLFEPILSCASIPSCDQIAMRTILSSCIAQQESLFKRTHPRLGRQLNDVLFILFARTLIPALIALHGLFFRNYLSMETANLLMMHLGVSSQLKVYESAVRGVCIKIRLTMIIPHIETTNSNVNGKIVNFLRFYHTSLLQRIPYLMLSSTNASIFGMYKPPFTALNRTLRLLTCHTVGVLHNQHMISPTYVDPVQVFAAGDIVGSAKSNVCISNTTLTKQMEHFSKTMAVSTHLANMNVSDETEYTSTDDSGETIQFNFGYERQLRDEETRSCISSECSVGSFSSKRMMNLNNNNNEEPNQVFHPSVYFIDDDWTIPLPVVAIDISLSRPDGGRDSPVFVTFSKSHLDISSFHDPSTLASFTIQYFETKSLFSYVDQNAMIKLLDLTDTLPNMVAPLTPFYKQVQYKACPNPFVDVSTVAPVVKRGRKPKAMLTLSKSKTLVNDHSSSMKTAQTSSSSPQHSSSAPQPQKSCDGAGPNLGVYIHIIKSKYKTYYAEYPVNGITDTIILVQMNQFQRVCRLLDINCARDQYHGQDGRNSNGHISNEESTYPYTNYFVVSNLDPYFPNSSFQVNREIALEKYIDSVFPTFLLTQGLLTETLSTVWNPLLISHKLRAVPKTTHVHPLHNYLNHIVKSEHPKIGATSIKSSHLRQLFSTDEDDLTALSSSSIPFHQICCDLVWSKELSSLQIWVKNYLTDNVVKDIFYQRFKHTCPNIRRDALSEGMFFSHDDYLIIQCDFSTNIRVSDLILYSVKIYLPGLCESQRKSCLGCATFIERLYIPQSNLKTLISQHTLQSQTSSLPPPEATAQIQYRLERRDDEEVNSPPPTPPPSSPPPPPKVGGFYL